MSNSGTLPVRLQPSNLRPIAYRILSKKHGLNLQTDALGVLTNTVSERFGAQWKGAQSQQFLEDIAKIWKQQDRGIFIDGSGLEIVIKELTSKPHGKKSDSSLDTLLGETDAPLKASRTDTIADDNGDENGDEKLHWQDFFRVLNPDEQPHYQFNRNRKQFGLLEKNSGLPGYLGSNIGYFGVRYGLLMDRLSRNDSFQKTSFASISKLSNKLGAASHEITLIKNVLGRDGSKFILFGLLSKNINGEYVLEDSTDHIELNLLQTYKTEGSFYCPGMFVIVEGIYSAAGGTMSNNANVISGCFHVSVMGHPPAERRDVSMDNYGNLDFLGLSTPDVKASNGLALIKINRALRKKLTGLEKALTNHKIVFLGSNCFLDDLHTLTGLKKLFGKLENTILDANDEESDGLQKEPLAIVMVGSFISRPLAATNSSVSSILNSENYKNNFDNLSDILSKFPALIRQTKFILIPGPNDPWQSTHSLGGSSLNVFPQKAIPKVFASRLERLLPKGNLILGWNPVRVSYLYQEIVVLKDELMNKFKRNDILFDHDLEQQRLEVEKENLQDGLDIANINTDEIHLSNKIRQARKLVKTLLDQGGLQPFSKSLKMVDTKYEHALRIEPLPSVIVLNDANFENFEVLYNGCKVVNVSKLIKANSRKLNYMEYQPAYKKMNFKEVYF